MKQRRLSPDTRLVDIDMPHWDVVLDEIFHVAPAWISSKARPETLGDVVAQSDMHPDKAWKRLESLIKMAVDVEISCEELKKALDAHEQLLLLDVRQPEEFAICRIEGSLLLCDADHHAIIAQLEAGTPAVTICHHGVRSFSAAMYFREKGFENVRSLAGGVDLWAQVVDPGMARY